MRSINIKFPLEDDKVKNNLFKMNCVTKSALTSNLLLLLLTEKGERYYMPNYGTNLKRFIFEPNDSVTIGDVEEEVRNTVKEFIPELTITSIDIYTTTDEDGNLMSEHEIRLLVNFSYDEGVFNETGVVEITF